MKASNNSDPGLCAKNLLVLMENEVPYARAKGVNPEIIDSVDMEDELLPEVDRLIETYEPRLDPEEVEVTSFNSGDVGLRINLIDRSDDTE